MFIRVSVNFIRKSSIFESLALFSNYSKGLFKKCTTHKIIYFDSLSLEKKDKLWHEKEKHFIACMAA